MQTTDGNRFPVEGFAPMSRRKKSSPPPTPTTSEQQQEQWQRHFDPLDPDESYSAIHLRDDLELIVNRRMSAADMDALEVEPRSSRRYLSLSPPPIIRGVKRHQPFLMRSAGLMRTLSWWAFGATALSSASSISSGGRTAHETQR